MESNSIVEWLLWKLDSLGVNSPSLTWMVLWPPEGKSMSVSVVPSMWGQVKVAPVLNVSSSVVEGSLENRVSPWSSNGITTWSESLETVLS